MSHHYQTQIPGRIVLATGNPGKVNEMQALLRALAIEVVPQSRFKVPSPEETGLSFVENALLKARHTAHHTGLPAIADDSGLVVDALHGAPGIYSSRYAGAGSSDEDNVQKLLAALQDVAAPRRSARFHCAMAYLQHEADPIPVICQASWEGSIMDAPRGTQGFGYDPVFHVPGHNCSAAELPPETKNRISHRGQALNMLIEQLDLIYAGQHDTDRSD